MLACLLALLVPGLSAQATGPEASRPVADPEIGTLVAAITDEIYANGYAREYLDVGFSGDSVPLYVEPHRANGLIWIIYKLLPIGEVLRAAHESQDGQLMLLEGDPSIGTINATNGAAMPTVYLRDEDVCRMKGAWRRLWFSVTIRPSKTQVDAAKRRQAVREKAKAG